MSKFVGPIPDPEGIGQVQEEILRRMLAAYQRLEASGTGDDFYRRTLQGWGVRWDHLRNQAGWLTRSEAAAASRALRRLEDRGLVQRRNQVSGDQYGGDPADDGLVRKHRTTHVRFTPEGRVTAARLTKGQSDAC